MLLHEDRLFPADPRSRDIARTLYATIKDLPLICPHGHTDPSWFSENPTFVDATELLIKPDHYVLRMLVSQGISLAQLGIERRNGGPSEDDNRKIWHVFAQNYDAFLGTPSRLWLDHTFQTLFGFETPLTPQTADHYFDQITAALQQDAYRPRGLYDRFGIELIATTDAATDDLIHHKAVSEDDWDGRVIPTYRPDSVVDPEQDGFLQNIRNLGELTGEDTLRWQGYLAAHRARRQVFIAHGATATDHGHPTAATADLDATHAEALFAKVLANPTPQEAELFRAQMLTEMAEMSVDDGLVMQLHAGSLRNHSQEVFDSYGRDKGFDIPVQTSFAEPLRPLLNKFGHDPRFTLVLFTLDETSYSRELAPLAGAYPCLRLGPAWWFFDSAAGMMRHRELTTETAGFRNTAGFNDDTRALPSIPARHDVARRVDCAYLAKLVAEHQLTEDQAAGVAFELTNGLVRETYKL